MVRVTQTIPFVMVWFSAACIKGHGSFSSTGLLERGVPYCKREHLVYISLVDRVHDLLLIKNVLSNFWQLEKMSLSPMTMTFVVVNLMLHALFQSNLGGKSSQTELT